MAPRYNLPIVTRLLVSTLLFLYFLSAAYQYRSKGLGFLPLYGDLSLVPQIVVIPNLTISYPWTILTATYVEANIAMLSASGLVLFFGGRYLERAWSSSQLATLMLLIAVVPNVACIILYSVILRMGILDPITSNVSVYGGIAYQAAFLIALKQLVPEHTVSLARNLVKIRIKHFPALFLLIQTLLSLTVGNGSAMLLAWLGFMTSWIYLRFYRRTQLLSTSHTGGGSTICGDASETFAFAYFFPDPIYTPVSTVSNLLYECLVSLKLHTPFTAEDVETSNEQTNARHDFGLPGMMNHGLYNDSGSARREEAGRRKALALKALDQRLFLSSANPIPDDRSFKGIGPDSQSSVTSPAPG